MKTKDRKNKMILMMIAIIVFIIISIVINQMLVTEERKNVDKQVKTSFTSTESLGTEGSNTENEIQESKTVENVKNTTQDTDFYQTENTILTTYKGYPVIAKLEIPKIDLETYVISEYSEAALGVSVTKFYGGNPNEVGNFCIAGHNYITKNMFHDLKKLSVGDTFSLIDTNHHKGIYKIYLVETVEPDETQCLSQKTEGRTEVTLITCTTDSSKRIIVKAVKI